MKYLNLVGSVALLNVWCQATWRNNNDVSSITDNHRHVSSTNENRSVTYNRVYGQTLSFVGITEENLNDNGDNSFLACRDSLLSPDLLLYQALCLIHIPPFRKLCRHKGVECDAYFPTISIVVMYRLVRLYSVTMSFVSF